MAQTIQFFHQFSSFELPDPDDFHHKKVDVPFFYTYKTKLLCLLEQYKWWVRLRYFSACIYFCKWHRKMVENGHDHIHTKCINGIFWRWLWTVFYRTDNQTEKQNKKWLIVTIYTLFEKSNFCPKIQFWQNSNIFTSFFHPNFFWQFFSWNQSCQQLKSAKPQHFHEFSPKTIRQFFSGIQSRMTISNSVIMLP